MKRKRNNKNMDIHYLSDKDLKSAVVIQTCYRQRALEISRNCIVFFKGLLQIY